MSRVVKFNLRATPHSKSGLGCKPWDKLVGRPLGSVLWVNHEEHVWEAGAKICSICVVVPGGLRCVDIHTFRAVKLNHGLPWDVRQACKKVFKRKKKQQKKTVKVTFWPISLL